MKYFFRLDFFENKEIFIVVAIIFGLLTLATISFFIAGRIKPSADLKELKARTRSWWIMAAIFIVATIFDTEFPMLPLLFFLLWLSEKCILYWDFVSQTGGLSSGLLFQYLFNTI